MINHSLLAPINVAKENQNLPNKTSGLIHNLFPTAVGTYKVNRELTEKELKFIKEQETRPNMGNITSVDNYILKNKILSKIRTFIQDSIKDYFETIYKPNNDVSLQITQSWLNYTEPGQHHHKHAHPNSFISGVFYPQANKETDKIFFFREQYQALSIKPREWNIWNSESWWLEVGTGDLMIFPSRLSHMVETVNGTDTRISLSFNTFPVGNLGDEKDLTGLRIETIKS